MSYTPASDETAAGIGSRFPAATLQTHFEEPHEDSLSQGIFVGGLGAFCLALAIIAPLILWWIVATHS